MSSGKTEAKSPIDELIERINRESKEIKKKFDDLIKAIEEDRKKISESGKTS